MYSSADEAARGCCTALDSIKEGIGLSRTSSPRRIPKSVIPSQRKYANKGVNVDLICSVDVKILKLLEIKKGNVDNRVKHANINVVLEIFSVF